MFEKATKHSVLFHFLRQDDELLCGGDLSLWASRGVLRHFFQLTHADRDGDQKTDYIRGRLGKLDAEKRICPKS